MVPDRDAGSPGPPASVLYDSLAAAIARPEWMVEASCRGHDPGIFFPGRGESTAPARAICAGCPVTEACLEYSMAIVEKQGIFGGKSERERRALRTTRPIAPRRCELSTCRAIFDPVSTSQRYCRPEHTALALTIRKRLSARRAG